MADSENKDKDFWGGLNRWDIIVLIERWVEENRWYAIKTRLPKKYIIDRGVQYAERRNKKGRAMRGIVMKVRIELLGKGREIETKLEGVMTREIEVNKDK